MVVHLHYSQFFRLKRSQNDHEVVERYAAEYREFWKNKTPQELTDVFFDIRNLLGTTRILAVIRQENIGEHSMERNSSPITGIFILSIENECPIVENFHAVHAQVIPDFIKELGRREIKIKKSIFLNYYENSGFMFKELPGLNQPIKVGDYYRLSVDDCLYGYAFAPTFLLDTPSIEAPPKTTPIEAPPKTTPQKKSDRKKRPVEVDQMTLSVLAHVSTEDNIYSSQSKNSCHQDKLDEKSSQGIEHELLPDTILSHHHKNVEEDGIEEEVQENTNEVNKTRLSANIFVENQSKDGQPVIKRGRTRGRPPKKH